MVRSSTREHGQLNKVNFLRELHVSVLAPWRHKHLTLFRIAVQCFEDFHFNMVQFCLFDVLREVAGFALHMDGMRFVEVRSDRLVCFLLCEEQPRTELEPEAISQGSAVAAR